MIKNSVGRHGTNDKGDVLTVKSLLSFVNPSLLYEPKELVTEDGSILVNTVIPDERVRPLFISEIERFQKKVVGGFKPDGLVEPGRRTIKALIRIFEDEGYVRLLKKQQLKGRLIPNSYFNIVGGSWFFSGRYGTGMTIYGMDGKRLILSVSRGDVIFMLLDQTGPGDIERDFNPLRGRIGGVYAQRVKAFHEEIVASWYARQYERLAPIQIAIEAELYFLVGLGTTLTGTSTVFAITSIGDFIARNHRKFKHWIAICVAIVSARKQLKRLAPTLYLKIFDMVVMHWLKSIRPQDKASTIGYVLAAMVKELGDQVLTKRLKVFNVVLRLVMKVVVMLLQAVANSVVRAQQSWERGIDQMRSDLSGLGITISRVEQLKIFDEIRRNAGPLKNLTEELAKEIQQHMYYL